MQRFSGVSSTKYIPSWGHEYNGTVQVVKVVMIQLRAKSGNYLVKDQVLFCFVTLMFHCQLFLPPPLSPG